MYNLDPHLLVGVLYEEKGEGLSEITFLSCQLVLSYVSLVSGLTVCTSNAFGDTRFTVSMINRGS